MADSKALARWLLSHSGELDLRATQLHWPDRWSMAGLKDFEVTLQIQGRKFAGRGTAHGEEFAFTKAGAEALERAICAANGIRTTGVAIHTEASAAKSNAQAELLERDSVFCHFFTKTPFISLDSKYAEELRAKYPVIFDQTELSGYSWNFFRTCSAEYSTVICLASGETARNPFGGLIGLGQKTSMKESTEVAFLECARNVAALFFQDGTDRDLSLDEFNRLSSPTSRDRQRLALNPHYWNQVKFLFQNSMTAKSTTIPTLQLQRLQVFPAEIADAPVIAYRATLDPKYGQPEFGNEVPVTRARLSEFSSRELAESNLNNLPHFLG